jgi:beta-glucanase (GH16 family)
MELVGHEPDKVYGTLHYGGQYPNNTFSGQSYVLQAGTFSDDFHVFAIEWDSTSIRWTMDGNPYHTKTVNQWYTTAAPRPAPFDQRFYMILNVAVGGNWPGSPDRTTVFPQRMTVDYVRVFQRKP